MSTLSNSDCGLSSWSVPPLDAPCWYPASELHLWIPLPAGGHSRPPPRALADISAIITIVVMASVPLVSSPSLRTSAPLVVPPIVVIIISPSSTVVSSTAPVVPVVIVSSSATPALCGVQQSLYPRSYSLVQIPCELVRYLRPLGVAESAPVSEPAMTQHVSVTQNITSPDVTHIQVRQVPVLDISRGHNLAYVHLVAKLVMKRSHIVA